MKRGPASRPDGSPVPSLRRVVALGGGTGMPAVLRGLRGLIAESGDGHDLTAIVTMTDDGGSSGRLRESMGLPPPGDVRNCLVALSEDEDLLAGLFQYRYTRSKELEGHSVGNLILAALAKQTGSFLKAVEVSSRVLRTSGRILPATLDDVRLEATLEDGSCISGETNIAASGKKIRRVALSPRNAGPAPGVLDAILDADLVVLGPGSLYTSLLPNIVVDGVGDALRRTEAPVVLVANLVSERGDAVGVDLVDHPSVINDHAGDDIVDAVLIHEGPIDPATLDRYRAEGASALHWPRSDHGGIRVVRRDLVAKGRKLRHDPVATAEGLIVAWNELAMVATGGDAR